MLKGIDVSEHQGHIKWDDVKGQIDFAMIRVGYGRGNMDKQFAQNITECNRLGIPCGVYWFSYALTPEMARLEAEFCALAVYPYKIQMPIAFDFEYDSINHAVKQGVVITKDIASAMVVQFCNTIENHGYWASMYTNLDYLNRYFNKSLLERYDLWLASWYNKPDFTKRPLNCGMWQWGTRPINGIYGNVDANVTYKDYLTLIKDVKHER